MKRLIAVLGVLLATGALGCTRKAGWPPEPAPVVLGEDTCDACRMIISDERFGAELVRRSGAVERFDDLGCLADRHAGESLPPEGLFVRAWAGGAWLRADRAWVVRSGELRSPMGYGLAGFADERSAREEAARHEGARVMRVTEALHDSALISKGEPR